MRYLKITTLLLLAFVTSISAQAQKINLSIKKELIINTSIAKSWQILGPEFTKADKWAATVSISKGKGKIIEGGIQSGRICTTPMGILTEKIIDYSIEKHLLSYQFEGMPKMIKYARNTWQLTSLGENKTKLTLHMEMRIGGLGVLMKPMIRMKMARMAKHTIEEFKYYVENDKPHKRKIKAIHKFNKKNLRK